MTIRCEIDPKTSIEPATPHIAPLSVSAHVVVRATWIPAYVAASRERPTARMRKPKLVRQSST